MAEPEPSDPRDPRPAGHRFKPTGRRGALAAALVRLSERLTGNGYLAVEYGQPDLDEPRYGWGRPPHTALARRLTESRDSMRMWLSIVESYGEPLAAIGRREADGEPQWGQHWFSGLSAACLYAFVRERAPRRFVEIGSGNSTLFAARAVRDGGLTTRLTSIDPAPRAEVDALCDEVVRAPFQTIDPSLFSTLGPTDIVLVDSSHYVFMNSDVTAFFLDALPLIPAGVLVGVHDVFLPDDYPWWLASRGYSEQYLLATVLLAGGERFRIVMADHFATTDGVLRPEVEAVWERMGLADVHPYGSCFWLEPAP